METSFINQEAYIDPDVYKAGFVILIIIMIMSFVLILLKSILENRLKNKMLDKGISENVIESILKKDPNSNKNNSVKWFLILLGLGSGLAIVNNSLPLAIHSFAIIFISVSVSFLLYSIYLRYFTK